MIYANMLKNVFVSLCPVKTISVIICFVLQIISFANVKYKVYPEIFPDVVPDYVHYAVKNEILTVLKHKDRLGRTIVMLRTCK